MHPDQAVKSINRQLFGEQPLSLQSLQDVNEKQYCTRLCLRLIDMLNFHAHRLNGQANTLCSAIKKQYNSQSQTNNYSARDVLNTLTEGTRLRGTSEQILTVKLPLLQQNRKSDKPTLLKEISLVNKNKIDSPINNFCKETGTKMTKAKQQVETQVLFEQLKQRNRSINRTIRKHIKRTERTFSHSYKPLH